MSSVYPSRPAERSIWREDFESPAKVHANGVTILGGAVPDRGLPCDGATVYATKAFPLGLRTEFNVEMNFTPDFAHDAGGYHYLFSSTGDSYRLFVHDNASLALYLNGTLIQSIAGGTYGAYWRTNERNRLIVSTNGTLTNAWLNGTQILTDDATGWTAGIKAELVIGSYAGGGSYFSGTYHGIHFRAGLLTAGDVTAMI